MHEQNVVAEEFVIAVVDFFVFHRIFAARSEVVVFTVAIGCEYVWKTEFCRFTKLADLDGVAGWTVESVGDGNNNIADLQKRGCFARITC